MTYIDIFLIIIFLFSFILGWNLRGIYVITIPIAFFSGILIANIGYHSLADMLTKHITNETKCFLISYTILFIITSSIVISIAYTFARFFDVFKLTIFDRILGAVIFICFISIPVYFTLIGLIKINFNWFNYNNALNNSLLFPYLEKLTFFIIRLPVLKHFFAIKKILI